MNFHQRQVDLNCIFLTQKEQEQGLLQVKHSLHHAEKETNLPSKLELRKAKGDAMILVKYCTVWSLNPEYIHKAAREIYPASSYLLNMT